MPKSRLSIKACEMDAPETAYATRLIRQLRNTLDKDMFLNRIEAAFKSGYKLLVVIKINHIVTALSYRITSDVCWGKTLYIDDLFVDPLQRDNGIDALLLSAAKKLAHQTNCDKIRLCSGKDRADTHRFYRSNNFKYFSNQFVQNLNSG